MFVDEKWIKSLFKRRTQTQDERTKPLKLLAQRNKINEKSFWISFSLQFLFRRRVTRVQARQPTGISDTLNAYTLSKPRARTRLCTNKVSERNSWLPTIHRSEHNNIFIVFNWTYGVEEIRFFLPFISRRSSLSLSILVATIFIRNHYLVPGDITWSIRSHWNEIQTTERVEFEFNLLTKLSKYWIANRSGEPLAAPRPNFGNLDMIINHSVCRWFVRVEKPSIR